MLSKYKDKCYNIGDYKVRDNLLVRFVEVISSIIGFALIVYSYLVAKRKNLI